MKRVLRAALLAQLQSACWGCQIDQNVEVAFWLAVKPPASYGLHLVWSDQGVRTSLQSLLAQTNAVDLTLAPYWSASASQYIGVQQQLLVCGQSHLQNVPFSRFARSSRVPAPAMRGLLSPSCI